MEVEGSNLVTVSCCDHGQYVAMALRNLFDSKRGTDFEVRLGGKSVRAHRLIVELFMAPLMIESDQNELRYPSGVKQEVSDDDCGSGRNVLDFVVEFMYKGEVGVPEQQLEDLLAVAKELDFQMLIDAVDVCRPIDIIADDELIHVTQSGIYCSRNVNEGKGGFLGSRMEDVKFNHETLHDTGSTQLDAKHEFALRPCSGNLGPQVEEATFIHENYDNTDSIQVNVKPELALRPCSVNLEPRFAECYQSVQSDITRMGGESRQNNVGHPLHVTKPQDFCVTSNADRIQYQFEPEENSADLHSRFEDSTNSLRQVLPNSVSTEQGYSGGTFENHLHPGTSNDANRKKPDKRRAPKRHKCPHCEFDTTTFSRFQAHLVSFHGVAPSVDPAPKHKCPHCEFQTTHLRSYRHHVLSVHQLTTRGEPAPMRKCSHCEFETSVSSNYHYHCLTVHQLTIKGELAPLFRCPKCDYSSVYLYKIKLHQRNRHSQVRNHACPHCPFTAKLGHHLKNHMTVIHGEGDTRFWCQVCNQRFESRARLERHLKIHNNERPFQCPHCNFDSNYEANLNRHLLIVHQQTMVPNVDNL